MTQRSPGGESGASGQGAEPKGSNQRGSQNERRDASPGEKGSNARDAQGQDRRGQPEHKGAQDHQRGQSGTTGQASPDRTQDRNQNRAQERNQDRDQNRTQDRAQDRNQGGRTGTETDRTQSQGGRTGSDTNVTGRTNTNVNLSSEQRTKIKEVVVNHRDIPRVSNVNVDIRVGSRIPRTGVNLVAVPQDIITIYPEFRRYRVVIIHDEIVFVDPDTYEIVFVMPG